MPKLTARLLANAVKRGLKQAARKTARNRKKRMRQAARLVAKDMRPRIPVGPGNVLRKSVTMTVTSDGQAFQVGPDNRKRGYHSHLVNDGTVERARESGGSTGKMTGINFIEKTDDATRDQVFSIVGRSLQGIF